MQSSELLEYLLQHNESEFVEFKDSNTHPENIGQLISALANGAVLEQKDEAYLVFGISDARKVVGTSFDPETSRKGNMPFKNWLATGLSHCGPLKYLTIDDQRGKV